MPIRPAPSSDIEIGSGTAVAAVLALLVTRNRVFPSSLPKLCCESERTFACRCVKFFTKGPKADIALVENLARALKTAPVLPRQV